MMSFEMANYNYKISIITINYNNAKGLSNTIQSVLSQTYGGYEYIIIDGGSTDGSLEVIEKSSDAISYWVSEPDEGIYNAMNKGIKKSSGEYLLMLNSGDMFYENDTLEKCIRKKLDEDICFGDAFSFGAGNDFFVHFPEKINFSLFLQHGIHHQSVFVRRNLHDSVGFYSEKLKIVSDWCFFIDAFCKYNCSYKHLPVVVSSCPRDGISCDPDMWSKIRAERTEYLDRYYSAFVRDYDDYMNLKNQLRTINKLKKVFNYSSWSAYIKKKFSKNKSICYES